MASPSPFPDPDPVSKLLAAIHLLDSDDTSEEGVDDMDVDPVLVVPDTPDRAAAVHSSSDRRPRWRRDPGVRNAGSSSAVAVGPPSNGSGNNMETVELNCASRSADAQHTRFPDRTVDSEHMLRQAKLKHFISSATGVEPSPDPKPEFGVSWSLNGSNKNAETSPFTHSQHTRFPGRSVDRFGINVGGGFDSEEAELSRRDKGKWTIDLGNDLQAKALERKMGQRSLTHNSYLAPCSTRKSCTRSKVDGQMTSKHAGGEAHTLFARSSDQDDRKGLDVYSVFENKDAEAPPRRLGGNAGQSRRGHECRTSYHHDTAWDSTVTEEDAGKMFEGCQLGDSTFTEEDAGKMFEGCQHGVLPRQTNIIDLDTEVSHLNRNKGKGKLDNSSVGNVQHVKSKTQSERLCLTGKNIPVIADVHNDTFRSSEDLGWRTTRNRTNKAPVYSLPGIADYSRDYIPIQDRSLVNIVEDSPEKTVVHHELNPNPARVSSWSEPESRRHQRRQKLAKEKRKCSSLFSTISESSSSVFGDLEYLHSQSFLPDFNSKSNGTANSQHNNTIVKPVMEVDKLFSPGVSCSSLQEQNQKVDDSSARERQVESDEILARQLQEQFYHESAGFGDEETDATIAWSLHEMEDAQRATSIAWHNRPHPRGTSNAHLYAHFPWSSYQNASAEATNRARLRTVRRAAQFRRNFNSPEAYGETGLNFLEALEAAFDDSTDMVTPSNFLQIERDFNENDYEMLLSLDDNIHHLGFSQSQINTLPQSVIQNDIGEACAVCLETPSIGDVIRHLPCLHKFHKECVDKWLRRKASCPICKSSITWT